MQLAMQCFVKRHLKSKTKEHQTKKKLCSDSFHSREMMVSNTLLNTGLIKREVTSKSIVCMFIESRQVLLNHWLVNIWHNVIEWWNTFYKNFSWEFNFCIINEEKKTNKRILKKMTKAKLVLLKKKTADTNVLSK